MGDAAAPFASIEELAEQYVAAIRTTQPNGPYALGGYSVGGLAAFEAARQLRAAGHAVALVALLDTWHPAAMRQQSALYGALGGAARLGRRLTGRRVLPAWLQTWMLDSAAMAQVRAAKDYEPRAADVPLTLFVSRELAPPDSIRAAKWRALATAGIVEIVVEGRHDTMLSPPHVEGLGQAFQRTLDAAIAEVSRASRS
jgi:thioesterase domain-containing protein